MMISEIVRGKALARVLEAAKVTDSAGHEVDLKALDAMAAGMTGLDASDLSDDLGDELDDELEDEDDLGDELDDELEDEDDLEDELGDDVSDELNEPADEIGHEAVDEAGGGAGGVTPDGAPDDSTLRRAAPATRPDAEAAAQS
jgi:hypothetical protein